MAEKNWIKIHSGLTNDPQHRERMGVRIWFFMWLVDHADYETGIVRNYTDAWAAQDDQLDMPESTVRKHRTGLQREGYIRCHQGFQCEHIRIMRWRNPKMVEARQVNIPDDPSTWCPLLGIQDTTSLGTHARSKVDTATLSDSQDSTPANLFEEILLGSWKLRYYKGIQLATETKARVGKCVRAVKEAGGDQEILHEAYRRFAQEHPDAEAPKDPGKLADRVALIIQERVAHEADMVAAIERDSEQTAIFDRDFAK